jgi:hypothetical protein
MMKFSTIDGATTLKAEPPPVLLVVALMPVVFAGTLF